MNIILYVSLKNIKMKIKTTVTDCYEQAREALKAGDRDKARDLADFGIVKVADARNEGMNIDDTLDDVRIGLWLERFWYFLENNNLLLGQDEEALSQLEFALNLTENNFLVSERILTQIIAIKERINKTRGL